VSRRSSIAERLTDNTVASYCASFAVDLVKGKKVAACAAVSVFAVKHKHAYGYFVTLLPCGRHDERLPDAEYCDENTFSPFKGRLPGGRKRMSLGRSLSGHSGHWSALEPNAWVANDPFETWSPRDARA